MDAFRIQVIIINTHLDLSLKAEQWHVKYQAASLKINSPYGPDTVPEVRNISKISSRSVDHAILTWPAILSRSRVPCEVSLRPLTEERFFFKNFCYIML